MFFAVTKLFQTKVRCESSLKAFLKDSRVVSSVLLVTWFRIFAGRKIERRWDLNEMCAITLINVAGGA